MGIKPNDINPIRFKNISSVDWDNTFPNDHNIELRTNYFPGEYEQSFYPTFIKDKTIYLQFPITGVANLNLMVTKPDSTTENITPLNISPSGWVGDPAYKYEYTPTTEGLYRFQFQSESVISDHIYVVDALKLRKKLIQIQYYNTENDLNTVFISSENVVFSPTAYLSAKTEAGFRNEKSTFETDRGQVSTNRSTPIPMLTLTIEAHRSQLSLINLIFACDRIIINGISYQNADAPEAEKDDKTDMYTVTVVLSETNYNYYRK